MTTSSPSRIWTGNWSTQQIEDHENMINPELILRLQPSTLSTILLPLEKIIAEGALSLWQCKVVQERRLSQGAKLASSPSVYQEPNKLPIHAKRKREPKPIPLHSCCSKSDKKRTSLPVNASIGTDFRPKRS